MPNVDVIRGVFGSFGAFAKEVGVGVSFDSGLDSGFWGDVGDPKILVDTRENLPLDFKNARTQKLDFGDYSLTPSEYTHTHVERKTFEDFASTVTNGYKRFLRELERCKSVDCFMFIVVEADIDKISPINNNNYKRYNMNYVFHQMRAIEAEYSDVCQFVFSGSRENSKTLIPKILLFGKKLWKVDLQYFWAKHMKENGLDSRRPEIEFKTRGYSPTFKRKRGLFGRARS